MTALPPGADPDFLPAGASIRPRRQTMPQGLVNPIQIDHPDADDARRTRSSRRPYAEVAYE